MHLISPASFRRLAVLGRAIARKFIKDNGLFLAAGLAFNVLVYCFPLALVVTAAMGYIAKPWDGMPAGLRDVLRGLLPDSQHAVTDTLTTVVANRHLLGLAGMVGLSLFSTIIFGTIRLVLNIVFGTRQFRPFLRGLTVDGVLMSVVVALVLVSVGLASVGVTGMNSVLGFLFAVMLFYLLYRFAPARTLGGRGLLIASMAGAGLLQATKMLFGLYVTLAGDYAGVYGALSGTIFFVLWIYYASLVFILGAVIGWVSEHTEPLEINEKF